MSSDLHPVEVDPNASTKTLKRKTMAIKISPEAVANITLGTITTGAVSLVIGAIFIWTIKLNGETALNELRALRDDFSKLQEEHRRMWYDYEQRVSTTRGPSRTVTSGP